MDTDGGQARPPVAVIANAHARQGADAFDHALDLLGRQGVPVGVSRLVDRPAALADLVAELIRDGYREIIVGGGDGTLSTVVGQFVGRPLTLGILPLGTGNLVARALGIAEVEAAVAAVAARRTATIDVCQAGGGYFVNSLSLGMASDFKRATSKGAKRRLGELAYAVAAVRVAARTQPFYALVTIDGEQTALTCYDLVVANGRFVAPQIAVAPDAGVASRSLVVFALGDRSRLSLVLDALRSVVHRAIWQPHLHRTALETVEIVADPPQDYLLDGEPRSTTPVTVRMIPAAVRVFVPAES